MRALLILACLLATACGRSPTGFIVSEDGRTLADDAPNNRGMVVESIRTQLDRQLGNHWRTQVALPELPTYRPADERSLHGGGWRWASATATVELVGDGTAPPPMATAAIRQAVLDYLSPKVDAPERQLTVAVTSVCDPARFAALAALAASSSASSPSLPPAAPRAPGDQGQRRYTLQSGDTLADISAAFYGSPQYWRLILDANPGLDAGALIPGTTLTIPPRP